MELEPTSENGKRLRQILSDWMGKSPDAAEDALTRVLLMYASEVENEDTFLDALYGQRVLEKAHLDLSQEKQQQQQSTATLSKVRHAIVTCVNTRRVKELVVALERSKNDTLLGAILKWSEAAWSKSMAESVSALSTIDLAPQRVARTFAAMLSSPRALSQKERNISLNGQSSRVFHVCRNCNRIIIGFVNGQIKIYESVELKCEATLPYCSNQSAATCFQCTCTRIIAGYENGNVCAWNVNSGSLAQRISVKSHGDNGYPFGMQLEGSKLAVATTDNRIQIWQYRNSTFTLLGGWNVTGIDVRPIEFDDYYVILQDIRSSSIHVYYPNGKFIRRIECQGNTAGMAYRNGKVITGGRDKVLRIWDVQTGVCLQELEGHDGEINCVQLQKDAILLTGSGSGMLTVWDMSATALFASPDSPARALSSDIPSRSVTVNTVADDSGPFKFGRNFVVRASGMSILRVIAFS